MAAEPLRRLRRQKRVLAAPWSWMVRGIAPPFAAFFIYTSYASVPRQYVLATYLGGILTLLFVLYPARKGSPAHRPSIGDAAFVVMALGPTIYYVANYQALLLRVGIVTDLEVAAGALMILASLEGARRILGPTLPLLGVVAILYNLFGDVLPGPFGHTGFSYQRVVAFMFGNDGIYGIVTRTFATYVVVFMIFGTLLQRGGAGQAFIRLALSLVGKREGGAAKASVVSSGLAGSVLGAGVGNITVTGTLTIPLMVKGGFPAHRAAATETVASISGHLLPPVMGAAAFLMASFTGVPYLYIISISLAPALLCYLTIYAQTHFYARKHGLGTRSEDAPRFLPTLRREGVFTLPIAVLVWALVAGYSPFRAAVLGMAATIAMSYIRAEYRLTPRKLWDALGEATQGNLVVGSTAGIMGIILAGVTLPGAALTFSSRLVSLAGGRLPVLLVLVLLASYVLGMGLTISAAYMLVVIVAAPPLVELGVPLLAAHMVVLWFSQDSSFTPPFALGAFVAAGIAQADPMRTAWSSVLLGKALYIIPLLMIYTPLLGLDGFDFATWRTVLTSAAGLVLFASITERYWYGRLSWFEVGLFTVAMALCFAPSLPTDIAGVAAGTAAVALHRLRCARSAAAHEDPAQRERDRGTGELHETERSE